VHRAMANNAAYRLLRLMAGKRIARAELLKLSGFQALKYFTL